MGNIIVSMYKDDSEQEQQPLLQEQQQQDGHFTESDTEVESDEVSDTEEVATTSDADRLALMERMMRELVRESKFKRGMLMQRLDVLEKTLDRIETNTLDILDDLAMSDDEDEDDESESESSSSSSEEEEEEVQKPVTPKRGRPRQR